MAKYFLLFFSILMIAAGCNSKAPAPSYPYTTPLQVGEKKIFVQTVSSLRDMEQGLSGRKKLTDEQGMLFSFGFRENIIPSFWMKDMLFDLDIIWIKDNVIVDISKNLPFPKKKSDRLPTYQPKINIDAVLEVNAGWTDENKIKTGDTIKLN